jgi:hypothetical protein
LGRRITSCTSVGGGPPPTGVCFPPSPPTTKGWGATTKGWGATTKGWDPTTKTLSNHEKILEVPICFLPVSRKGNFAHRGCRPIAALARDSPKLRWSTSLHCIGPLYRRFASLHCFLAKGHTVQGIVRG